MTPFRTALKSFPPMQMVPVSRRARPVSILMVVIVEATVGAGKIEPFAADGSKKSIVNQRPPTASAAYNWGRS